MRAETTLPLEREDVTNYHHRIRNDRRGHAGFAVVAVALLIAGASAAIYLQAASMDATDGAAEHSAELSSIDLAATQESQVLSGMAVQVLQDVLRSHGESASSVALIAPLFENSLREKINATYPRENSLGQKVRVDLAFARVVPQSGWAPAASPGGIRTLMDLPLFMAAEGGADVQVTSANGVRSNTFVGFGGAAPAPSLLPVSLSSRIALETASGGRIERFVGQAAQAYLQSAAQADFSGAVARALVVLGLRLELASQYLSSGNATLDAFLSGRALLGGNYTAADFVEGSPASFYEIFPAPPVGRPVQVDLAQGDFRLEVFNFSDSQLGVYRSFELFDSQELGGNTWAALTVEAWGSISFAVRIVGLQGSFESGPLQVPVSFNARAARENVTPSLIVSPDAIAVALSLAAKPVTGLPYRMSLLEAGIAPDANGTFADNATVRAVLAKSIAENQRAGLPPVEDAAAFLRAYSAPREDHVGVLLKPVADTGLNGSRALLTVDGVAWQSAIVQTGTARFHALPAGSHNLSLAVEQGGRRLVGGGRFDVGGEPWSAEIPLEAVADAAFLRGALRNTAVAAPNATAGEALLREAGSLAGLGAPPDGRSGADIRAYCDLALTRLEALSASGVLSMAQRVRSQQAAGALKILSGLIDAADAAYQGRTGSNQSVGGLTASLAILSFTRNPVELIYVTAAATKVASVSLEEGGVLVRFFKDDRAVRQMLFRLDELALVAEALGGALSLTSDLVTIRQELDQKDWVGFSLTAAKAQLHLADLTVGVAKGVYGLAGAATPALKVAFRTAGLAVGAAALVLDVALLYHEHNGNWTAMGEALIHPADLAGMLTLPGMVGSGIATVAGLVALSVGSSVQFGPIGLAVALFVLAGLILINGRDVASAIFGTLPEKAAQNISETLAPAASSLFGAAVAANAADPHALVASARAATERASSLGLEASIALTGGEIAALQAAAAQWRERARAYGILASAALRLRHAAGAAVEQLDDFASGAFVNDPGRQTEGYTHIRDALAREYPYEGHVVVERSAGNVSIPQLRVEWRRLLDAPSLGDLGPYSIRFNLTQSNSIPSGQFSIWSDNFGASVKQVQAALARFDEARSVLADATAA